MRRTWRLAAEPCLSCQAARPPGRTTHLHASTSRSKLNASGSIDGCVVGGGRWGVTDHRVSKSERWGRSVSCCLTNTRRPSRIALQQRSTSPMQLTRHSVEFASPNGARCHNHKPSRGTEEGVGVQVIRPGAKLSFGQRSGPEAQRAEWSESAFSPRLTSAGADFATLFSSNTSVRTSGRSPVPPPGRSPKGIFWG